MSDYIEHLFIKEKKNKRSERFVHVKRKEFIYSVYLEMNGWVTFSQLRHVVSTFLSFLRAFSAAFSLGIDLLRLLTATVTDLTMRAGVLIFVLFLAFIDRRKAAEENPRLLSRIAFGSCAKQNTPQVVFQRS